MRRFIQTIAGPLDDRTKTRPSDERGRAEHAGLLLQRYLCENATGDDGNPEEKRALLVSAIQAATNSSAIYQTAYQRWEQFLNAPSHATTCHKVVETDGRVIVGLGTENVLETGIRLHHTYGMPVLPGSAIKGLAAHYCHQVWGSADEAYREGNRLHMLLFGETGDRGCIRFCDAWLTPDSPSPLRIDVMTPHHPEWLDGKKPPSDFDSPIPIPFLSVAGRFHVAVQWQGPETDHAADWTQRVLDLVLLALSDWGIGSKTSSGYGRIVDPEYLRSSQTSQTSPAKSHVALQSIPKPGNEVNVLLCEEKTKKEGWRAIHQESQLTGPIQNSADVPGDKNAGDTLVVIVASANEHSIAFRYPTAVDHARKEKQSQKNRGGKRR